MSESAKTITYVCVAAILSAVAGGLLYSNTPKVVDGFEKVGQPFFDEFTSSKQAKALEVAAIDPATAKPQDFSIRNSDGVWRIPSHYNYPAEAAERLGKTASSVLGLTRESLASRYATDHERLGVVDPKGDEIGDPESVGKRITLKDGDGETLVDYIIGKKIEEPTVGNSVDEATTELYYVRRADENETYKVALNVSLSTKFSDWIEPDLLKLEASELRKLSTDNYSLEERAAGPGGQFVQMMKVPGDQLAFSRETGFGAWELPGVDAEKEEIQAARIDEIGTALTAVKVAGVRPKFKYKDQNLLGPDLELMELPELKANPRLFQEVAAELQSDLAQHGYNFAQNPETQALMLVSSFGELQATTEDGMLYRMYFGRPVEDDEVEISIGSTDDSEAKEDDDVDSAAEEKPTGEDSTEEKQEEDVKNRFLMISVQFSKEAFDEFNLPAEPTAPVEPTKPEGYTPAPPKDAAEPDADAAPVPGTEQQPDTGAEADSKPEIPERDPAFVAYDDAMKIFEQAKTEYELASTKHKDDLEKYNEDKAKAEEKAVELNSRFGDWFYVISADNLKSLRVARTDVVKAKEADEKETPGPDAGDGPGMASPPDISFPEGDGVDGTAEEGTGSPNSDSPEGDDSQGEDSTNDSSKVDDDTPQATEGDGNSSGNESNAEPKPGDEGSNGDAQNADNPAETAAGENGEPVK